MRKEIFIITDLIITENDTQKINKSIILEIFNERNGNDIDKYTFFKNNNGNQYLEEFPEYFFSGYIPFATNTGLMCFYKDPTLVVYDLTKENKSVNLDSINPDTSFFIDYNYISTPLNVRKINYKYNANDKKYYFIADKEYTKEGLKYCFFNCDKINEEISNDNGYFKSDNKVDSVTYYYKPILYIRAYNNDGSENTIISLKIQDKDMLQKTEFINGTEKKTNIFYYDCSNFDVGTDLKLTLKLEENNNIGGYLEVM